MLRLSTAAYRMMVAHCLDELPYEGCGLLAGAPDGEDGGTTAVRCYPTPNAARSSLVYEVDGLAHLQADRDAEANGMAIVGVFHSHTHTDAYPSPTDVAQAPDPTWHYVLVSLRDEAPVVRSYRIAGGKISEERVVLDHR